MRSMRVLLPTFVLAMTGCASLSGHVIQPSPPQATPPQAELLIKREPNLRQRLRQLSTGSPPTATPQSAKETL
ncbi:o-spanin [Stenotrophomonas phage Sonora]|nr:o-spanin [Stenotrophomonas phage Sonora]